ncbi:hypothetical protein G6F57_017894 [Rhizopus arrhizus]|nr:hypothetical protein G6F57_017894 [Rhizopus arrhizus]
MPMRPPSSRRNAHVFKRNLAGVRGVLAQLVFDAQHLIPRRVGRHDEGGNAALAGVRISHGEDDHRLAAFARGDELLGAVQDVVVAVAAGPGAQAAGIGPRLRLGQRKAPDVFARGQRPQELVLLRIGAELQDRHAGNRVVHAHDRGTRAVACGNFFQRHRIRDIAAGVARGIRGRGPSVRRWAPGVRPQSGAPFPECSAVLPSTTWSCLLDIRVRTGAGWALPALFCFARTWLAGAPRNREYTVRRAGSMRRVCADASARHASERSPGCPPGAPP